MTLGGDRRLPHSPDFPHLDPAPEDTTGSHLPVPRVNCLLLPEQEEPKNSQTEGAVAPNSQVLRPAKVHMVCGSVLRARGGRPTPPLSGSLHQGGASRSLTTGEARDSQPLPCTWDGTEMSSDASMSAPGALGFV